MKYLVRFLFLIVLAGLFFSCIQDEECRKDRYVRLRGGFSAIYTDSLTFVDSRRDLLIDSLTVKGVNVDSVLYNKSKKASKIELPLNRFKNRSDFHFVFNTVVDTVSVFYTVNESYLSFECGCLSLFTIDSIKPTKNYIDSIVVKSYDINTQDVQNIQIYHTNK